MQTATVADLRNDFARISQWISEGESVRITKRGRLFATLVPATKKRRVSPWPNLEDRMIRPAKGVSSDVIEYLRGDS